MLQKGSKKETRDSNGTIVSVPADPLLAPAQVQELEDLFELYVDEAFVKLDLYREHEALKCVNIQMIINLCSFLECFITNYKTVFQKEDKDVWGRPLNACFAFSFYWAFGGHFRASAMRFLDNMMRDFFAKH